MTNLERMRSFGKQIKKAVWQRITSKQDDDDPKAIKLPKGFKADPRTIVYYGMVVNGKLVLMEPLAPGGGEKLQQQEAELIKKAIAQGGVIGHVKCVMDPKPVEFRAITDFSEEED